MRPIRNFIVLPSLPPQLERLRALAYNLRWAWDHDTIELFRRLDTELWETSGHNPIRMLGRLDQAKLEAAAKDESVLAHLDRVSRELNAYLEINSTWYERLNVTAEGLLVAYFSAEFGLTECLSVFAGGLGVLAGDHLKSASDLGIPLVGVGLLYQQGYFRQYLNAAGWQQEHYEENDFQNLPLMLERRPDGAPLTVSIAFDSRQVRAQIWRVRVGRISLYLLDANLAENRPEDRDITDQLYGGGTEMRLKQEILLGIGGYRALDALGLRPTVCHMNEGHSALLSVEWVRYLMAERGLSFPEAREVASAGLVFTEHTPVAAGHDYFSPGLLDRYLTSYYGPLGLSRMEFLGLGRQNPDNDNEDFCMTVLALRMASASNGVSKLHGKVSREMWKSLWPEVPQEEIPIGSITNGVHLRSWISYEMNQLYDRYLGPKWREEHADAKLWERAQGIPAEELWRTHERRRERLVAFSRRRLRQQLQNRGASQAAIDAADEILDPDALTMGFARRFATYKRATLLLQDVERLGRILNDPHRPVQILFAGKAHPRDDAGKALIQQIIKLTERPEFRRRVVFLEDYDMAVARYLVQGCDVWLNTPIRPLEASGTSGMKALANGGLNVSTLDGWFDEAWWESAESGQFVGWAIGRGETYRDDNYRDQIEATALYDLLERDIVPTYYERSADGLPRRWIARMKSSIARNCPEFNMQRVVKQYTTGFYLPAHGLRQELTLNQAARAKELAQWRLRVQRAWHEVRVVEVDAVAGDSVEAGRSIDVQARVSLGSLPYEDVTVELYFGRIDAHEQFADATAIPMLFVGREADGSCTFQAAGVECRNSGRHGYTVRVLPFHAGEARGLLPGLIRWADVSAQTASAG